MNNEQLIELFSKLLSVDCAVSIENEFYKIEFIKLDQLPLSQEEFLQECQEFLLNYWSNIDIQQSVMYIKKTAEFEKGLENLNKVVTLHEIVRFGSKEDLNNLLKQEVDVNTINLQGETPLISAAYANNPANAEFLLEHGANINHQDKGGATALHIAVGQYDKDCNFIDSFPMVELLLNKGSNPLIETKKGETALHVAYRVEYTEVAELIVDTFKKQNPYFPEEQLIKWVENAKNPVGIATQGTLSGAEVSSKALGGRGSLFYRAPQVNPNKEEEQQELNASFLAF